MHARQNTIGDLKKLIFLRLSGKTRNLLSLTAPFSLACKKKFCTGFDQGLQLWINESVGTWECGHSEMRFCVSYSIYLGSLAFAGSSQIKILLSQVQTQQFSGTSLIFGVVL